MNEVTKDNFAKYLKATEAQDHTVASRCQAMILFGFAHYKEHGDTRYLASVMNGNFRASRRDGFRAYIVAFTNLKCQRVDPSKVTSELKFTVDAKSKNKTRTVAIPVNKETGEAETWYEHTNEVINVALDVDKRIKSLIVQIKNAVTGKDGKKLTKSCSKAHANEQIASLEALVA